MPELDLNSQILSLLFVASEALTVNRLAEATNQSAQQVTAALSELAASLNQTGLRLNELDGKYRLVTAPEAAPIVRRFLQDESNAELSRPALETLAIVAYRGPLTKTQVESLRGVASDTMLRNLMARGLIMEAGKSTEPGRPVLYKVSHTFLQHFGLANLGELPPLPDTGEADAN